MPELTAKQAASEVGIDARTLRDGFKLRKLRGHERGRFLYFELDELREDLAACPCSRPDCSAPAPGKSGRCNRHQAGGEPPVDLICQCCGEAFQKPVSWLKGRPGRGHYCSNTCKGRAIDAEELRQRGLSGARAASKHQAHVDEQADKLGVRTATLAAALFTSESTVRATAPGLIGSQVVIIDGSKRLIHPADSVSRYPREWVRDESYGWRRERYLDPDAAMRQQDSRINSREAERAVRERIGQRGRLFRARRKGRLSRGAPPAIHFRWERRFSEIEAEFTERFNLYHLAADRPPSRREISRQVAGELGISAEALRKAVERVRLWKTRVAASS